METKTQQNGSTTQGVDVPPTPDQETIEKWLERDLSIAITLLNAIHNDKNLQKQMSAWFLGKIENERNKAKNGVNPNQLDAFPTKK